MLKDTNFNYEEWLQFADKAFVKMMDDEINLRHPFLVTIKVYENGFPYQKYKTFLFSDWFFTIAMKMTDMEAFEQLKPALSNTVRDMWDDTSDRFVFDFFKLFFHVKQPYDSGFRSRMMFMTDLIFRQLLLTTIRPYIFEIVLRLDVLELLVHPFQVVAYDIQYENFFSLLSENVSFANQVRIIKYLGRFQRDWSFWDRLESSWESASNNLKQILLMECELIADWRSDMMDDIVEQSIACCDVLVKNPEFEGKSLDPILLRIMEFAGPLYFRIVSKMEGHESLFLRAVIRVTDNHRKRKLVRRSMRIAKKTKLN
jgi:hypothetical protein